MLFFNSENYGEERGFYLNYWNNLNLDKQV